MPELTKEDLHDALRNVATKDDLKAFATKTDIEEMGTHFNKALQTSAQEILGRIDGLTTHVDQFEDEVNRKLDAVLELLASRQHLLNLLRELKEHGITIDETKIFVT